MTIWSGRTQRSIASGFAADPVGGNRTLRSVAAPVGAATPTPSVSQSKRKPPIPHAA